MGLALSSGTSPYCLARLADEYPDVFEEYARAFDAPERKPFRERRRDSRCSRVGRLLSRMAG